MPSFQVNAKWAQMGEVCPGLFISGVSALKPVELDRLGITMIVNATCEVPNLNLPDIHRVKLWLDDTEETDISEFLRTIPDQIEMLLREGGRVLVHCVAGVSRSASLCLAYLLKFRCKTLREAYWMLAGRRPMVRPNLGFWKQLIDLELEIKGRVSVRVVESTDETSQQLPDVYLPMVVQDRVTDDKENEGPYVSETRERQGSGSKPRFVPQLETVPETEP